MNGEYDMSLSFENVIRLKNKRYKISDITEKLMYLDVEILVNFFKSNSLTIPRTERTKIFKLPLESKIKMELSEKGKIGDDFIQSLKWFKDFSDYQAFKVYKTYLDEKLKTKFFKTFYLMVINLLNDQKKNEALILDLLSLISKKSKELPDFTEFNEKIEEILKDEDDHIDGLSLDEIRPMLYNCSTLNEIRELGKKYSVSVPRRLKKAELLENIFHELKIKKQLVEKVMIDLAKKSALMLQRFAIDNKLKVSMELKKEEIIEYILKYSPKTMSFYKPPSKEAYSLDKEQSYSETQPENRKKSILSKKKKNIKEQKETKKSLKAKVKTKKQRGVISNLIYLFFNLIWRLIKFGIVLLLITLILLFVYLIFNYFYQVPELKELNDFINSFKINGTGTIDFFNQVLNNLGI